jgi:hypothetical protein
MRLDREDEPACAHEFLDVHRDVLHDCRALRCRAAPRWPPVVWLPPTARRTPPVMGTSGASQPGGS